MCGAQDGGLTLPEFVLVQLEGYTGSLDLRSGGSPVLGDCHGQEPGRDCGEGSRRLREVQAASGLVDVLVESISFSEHVIVMV